MISFALTEDQQMVQETVRKFAAEEIRPRLRDYEKSRDVPDELRKKFHDLGVSLVDVPESLGGVGFGSFTAALVHEELACGDPGAAVTLWAPPPGAAGPLGAGAGGEGQSRGARAPAHGELAGGDRGAAVPLWAPPLVPAALVERGTGEQAKRWLARRRHQVR